MWLSLPSVARAGGQAMSPSGSQRFGRRLNAIGRHVCVIHRSASVAVRANSTAAGGDGLQRGLVSCEWLQEEMASSRQGDLRVVDATWYLNNSPFGPPQGSKGSGFADFQVGPRIPGSVFFDVDAESTQHPAGLPHMLPSAEQFSAAMARLGITRSSRVVVYDRHGIFSAPRLWYTLKVAFGHPGDVAVLDGGLPRWTALGLPTEAGTPVQPAAVAARDEWQLQGQAVWSKDQVRSNIGAADGALLVDARPAARYDGTVPEPREGMRGGHIPQSVNVPFVSLLTESAEKGKIMMAPEKLQEHFKAAGADLPALAAKGGGGPSVVNSCGSGMTACLVSLAMHQAGLPLSKLALYDGSWSEWGAQADTPIVRKTKDGGEEPVP
eukprot:TRINITY_DN66111_c0_g1_i1.p1 TRINITY_DN66111_c0_g1~~TRINITY_DN66111_c0_g1_i1.p1  ORF type:complete len:381 (+),score=79.51 TRINITY_DN66111_c0_g1_i1:50-1192(+)